MLFIDTPMKVANPNYADTVAEPLNLTLRGKIGIQLKPEQTNQVGKSLEYLLEHAADYSQKIAELTDEYLYHMGHSGEIGGRYILSSLQKKAKNKPQNLH